MDFFVVGTSRSGSTLLRQMLAQHCNVAILNESHWLPWMWDAYGPTTTAIDNLLSSVNLTEWDTGERVVDVNLALGGVTWTGLVDELHRRLGHVSSVAAFHDAVVDIIFKVEPGSVLRGDKTPDYGFYMGALQCIWPGARFIHIVRNGIDAARSMSLHSGCQLMISAGYDNWVPLSFGGIYHQHKRIELPLSSYIASWRRRIARIRIEASNLKKNTYREIRYEALVAEPEQVLGEVATYLGLDPHLSWLSSCAQLVKVRKASAPISTDVLRQLTLEDIQALNEVGDVEFFPFRSDCNSDYLEAALTRATAKCGHLGADDAIRTAIGVLATKMAAQSAQLRTGAFALLAEALNLRGDNPAEWTLLSEVSTRPQ